MAIYLASKLYNPNFSTAAGAGSPPAGPAGGGLTGNYPNPAIGPSGVTPGSYGNGTSVAQVTVASDGRVTNVTNVPISVAPSGPAGGDLRGNFPSPTVFSVNGSRVNAAIDAVGATYFSEAPMIDTVRHYNGQSTVVDDGQTFTTRVLIGTQATGFANRSAVANIYIKGSEDLDLEGSYSAHLIIHAYYSGAVWTQNIFGVYENKTGLFASGLAAAFAAPGTPTAGQIVLQMKSGSDNNGSPIRWTWFAVVIDSGST